MKIYEIGTGYTPIPAQISAATEIVVAELTKAFVKQNIPVEIIDIATEKRAETDLPILEVPVPRVFSGTDVHLGIMHKLKRVVYSIALAGVLKRLLKQAQEKIVLHFHNQYNMFFFLKLVPQKLRNRCLIAYTNHSGIWRLPWSEIEETIHKRYFQEAKCMKQADLVFVLNEETKRNAVEYLGVAQERVVVINNGVNTDVYCPLSAEERESAKEKFGLQNRRVILQVGSVYENKGQLRSVEYLLPLLKENKDLVYAYVGGIVDEEYQQQIKTFAEESGLVEQVRYLGMVSPGKELNELYNLARATIMLSRYEGFSLAVIESLSAGTPVLMDKIAPFNLGAGCITFSQTDFVDVMHPVLMGDASTTYIRCKAAARQNTYENYSWEQVARSYMKWFQMHLGSGGDKC